MAKELNENLVKLWNAVYSEIYEDKQQTVGKILTIMDAVIVDSKQNKSVKDLVKQSIWEDFSNRSDRVAEWMLWFSSNNKIKNSDNGSSVPYKYDGEDRNPSLANYIK